jgi:hypothetical protein
MLGAAGLTVDSQSPDALCPPLEETRRLVAARLGSVELEGAWRASYVLVHREPGDFVSLTLFDAEGVLRMERQLPVEGGSSCAALSGVIALVLERYFLRPEQSAQPAPEQPPAVPAAMPAAPPATSAPAPREATAPLAVPTPRARVAPAADPFRLDAALWASTSWLAPSLRFERRLSGPYRLGLGAGFDVLKHETSAFEGSVSVRRVPISLVGTRELTHGSAVRARASLELLFVLESARAASLARSSDGVRVVPAAGARIGASFFNDSIVSPLIELTAAWLFGDAAPAFQVGGREVLAPPAVVLGLAVGIGTPF